jgi:hypothetical protein
MHSKDITSGLPALLLLACAVVLVAWGSYGGDYDGQPVPPELAVHARVTGPLPPGVALPLYSLDSPWNQPIPDGAPLDPNSDAMVEQLVHDVETGNPPTLSVREWSVTVYVADEATPRTEVELTAGWSPYAALTDVPIPAGALPDPEGDGHLTVIDLSTGYEYDFWQAEQQHKTDRQRREYQRPGRQPPGAGGSSPEQRANEPRCPQPHPCPLRLSEHQAQQLARQQEQNRSATAGMPSPPQGQRDHQDEIRPKETGPPDG